MKKLVVTTIIMLALSLNANAQLGGLINKAKDAASNKAKEKVSEKTHKATAKVAGSNPISGINKSPASSNTKAMEGKWKVEGVICNTENEALKSQLVAQEQGYNDEYKGFDWIFKNDGTIDIASKSGRSNGRYELSGDKISMEINSMPSQYTLKFEDGQMFLIQESPLNTIYYVFVKG